MSTKEELLVFLRLKVKTEKEQIARRISDVSEIIGVCLGFNEVIMKTGNVEKIIKAA